MKTAKQLVEEALAQIETMSVSQVLDALARNEVLLVDLRDIRELKHEGKIEGAVHVPRGMLEFWIDPESSYHKAELTTDKKLVFFCAAGWRSALATKTAMEMGFENVAHIEGGFGGWRDADAPVVEASKRIID